MSEFQTLPTERPAATSIAFILLTVLVGFYLAGPMIGMVIAIPFMNTSLQDFVDQLSRQHLDPAMQTPIMIIQGSATFFGLVVGPWLYWFSSEKKNVIGLFPRSGATPLTLLLTALAVITFTAPNSIIIDWNAHLVFPDALREFESWARHAEAEAEKLTKFITTFSSPLDFIFGFFVIAILPGVGEELVFRGMLQPKLAKLTGNTHAAIWISAFMFSTMHLQFFGFLPRMLLGGLFGYLYAWSGNLAIPMVAHIVNNGFSLALLYLYQLGMIDLDPESTDTLPWPALIIGVILTFGLLRYLRKNLVAQTKPA